MKVIHNLKPIYDQNSIVLILGSMPSIISRQENFYYANPTNRFWQILENLFEVQLNTFEDKRNFLLQNNIALWDTIKSCDIESSKDSSIKNVETNDIKRLLKTTKIKYIFCTGRKSYEIFNKYFDLDIEVFYLPSPSSANARKSLEELVKDYKIIKEKLLTNK